MITMWLFKGCSLIRYRGTVHHSHHHTSCEEELGRPRLVVMSTQIAIKKLCPTGNPAYCTDICTSQIDIDTGIAVQSDSDSDANTVDMQVQARLFADTT